MNFTLFPRLSALLLVAAACTISSGSSSAKDVVLGASVQLTGPVANTGRYYRDAYQIARRTVALPVSSKITHREHDDKARRDQ
jgi:hypothetical protein